MKTAIVLGATGLVGKQLVKKLLVNFSFAKVKIFVRRSTGIKDPKLEEHIINFDKPDEWKRLVTGDVLFSAFGTTLAKAGGKDAQYKIDYTYQYRMAAIAADNKVPVYVLISSAGASPSAMVFYSKMKGELERDIMRLPFEKIHIIRPGLLAGDRDEKRMGEVIGEKVLNIAALIPAFNKYKPIKDVQVADAMIHAALKNDKGIYRYTLQDVFDLAAMRI
ncbi:MAG: NADH-quinone oxidoreductase subunit F [Sphingobacteriales bacterium]|nr:MAG: NADH-quinone oxidoreductase subunit F [Sphingobacteriales bacterium]